MLRQLSMIGLSALTLMALPLHAQERVQQLEIYEYPQNSISTEYLSLRSSTFTEDEEIEVRFRNLAPNGRVLLTAFHSDYFGPWRVAHRREFRDRSDGVWVTPLEASGEYLLCAASERDVEGAWPPPAPHLFNECVRVFAVAGPASDTPEPSVRFLSDYIRTGDQFIVEYENMPTYEGARIEIVRKGFPNHSIIPPVRHPTRGERHGSIRAALSEPGAYELRIMYDNIGRQVRARQIFEVHPR